MWIRNGRVDGTISSFGTTIYGLELGEPSGFKIAGGKFKIPDYTIGNVGMKDVLAEFVRLSDGSYSIAAGAKIGFEAFAVDGGFTLLYIPQPPDVRLRQVRLAFEGTVTGGTAIPPKRRSGRVCVWPKRDRRSDRPVDRRSDHGDQPIEPAVDRAYGA